MLCKDKPSGPIINFTGGSAISQTKTFSLRSTLAGGGTAAFAFGGGGVTAAVCAAPGAFGGACPAVAGLWLFGASGAFGGEGSGSAPAFAGGGAFTAVGVALASAALKNCVIRGRFAEWSYKGP